jgi:outer membrane protein OmpA-like peptidoglycan-associated protein/uncharacterized membrane protein YeaQ/YmgE (transglycosylase-associated protein family)
MDVFINIAMWVIFGLIAGAVAKFLMPGKDPGGVIITMLLGLAGALVGGFIGNAVGFGWVSSPEGRSLLDWRNLLLAIAGAFLLLLAYRAFKMLFGSMEPGGAYSGTSTAHSAYESPAAPNLTETVKNAITPDVVQKLSSVVGESASHTRKAVEAMIPTVMAGVAHAAANPSGATRVFELAKESAEAGADLSSNLASHLGGAGIENMGRTGHNILSAIFGDKLSSLLSWFGKYAGIKSASVSSLMGVVSSLVMNVLGRQVVHNGLSASGLSSLLSGQQGWLSRLLPRGLSEVPGLSALADYAGHAAAAVGSAAHAGEQAVRGAAHAGERVIRGAAGEAYRGGAAVAEGVKPWASALVPLLLVALALAALPWLLRSWTTPATTPEHPPVAKGPETNHPDVRATPVTDTGTRGSGYFGPDLAKLATLKLPDGVNLDVPEGSFLNDMHKYLVDKADTTARSFPFEKLNFDGASVKTTPVTEKYVTAVSTLVKAFPGVQLRIVGHTDNQGDQEANRRLSLERANAVKDLLVKAGVPAERITTEGLGSEKPVAPNDTEENRAKNRRIELALTKK